MIEVTSADAALPRVGDVFCQSYEKPKQEVEGASTGVTSESSVESTIVMNRVPCGYYRLCVYTRNAHSTASHLDLAPIPSVLRRVSLNEHSTSDIKLSVER